MSVTRYSTSVTVCEDTTTSLEIYDLLRQADPGYASNNPFEIKLYIHNGSEYVEAGSGFFTAQDSDTLRVDLTQLPNFNGQQQVRVYGADSSGYVFYLDVTINVTSANDAPEGADANIALDGGVTYILHASSFGFSDVDGNAMKSVVINTVPTAGSLTLDGVAVAAGQEISVADLDAGKLKYQAPADAGGAFGLDFSVRDDGGSAGCNSVDLDPTPNTLTFNVPQPVLGAIGDLVWEDSNGNGVQDANEAGIANVTINLKNDTGQVVKTTTTDASGVYKFDVVAGVYSISVVKPAGYVVADIDVGSNDAKDSDIDASGNSAKVSVAAGQVIDTLDAGLYRGASVGDRVWIDTNRNGVQDDGNTGVQGVRVYLVDTLGNAVTSTVTDADGNYLFDGVKPGTYSLRFDQASLPAGYSFTIPNLADDKSLFDSDADQLTGQTIYFDLPSGTSDRSWDAGIVSNFGSISGRALADTNNDDLGDAVLSGVTITLRDSANVIIATALTDANGNYSFANLLAGNYTVSQANLPGYVDVGDKDGGDPNLISVSLGAGQNSTGNDFVDEAAASLGNRVWDDCNNNGIQDAGEVGVADVTVNLLDASGAVKATTTTTSNGSYVFENLNAGDYAVQVVAPAGMHFGKKDLGGNDAMDSDVDANGRSALTTLDAGENDMSVDAGLVKNPICITYDFSSNNCNTVCHGNSRSYTVEGVTVTASAWSEDKCNGAWAKAYLGAYDVGHGVTDSSRHDSAFVDNSGRNNYVVYQFSQDVTVDKAFLACVDCDSDLQVWIGSSSTPITSMNSSVLASLGFTEFNSTNSSAARWADFNNGGVTGNVLIIAADTATGSPNDYFTIEKLSICTIPPCEAVVEKASIGDKVWEDKNFNGIQDAGESGIAGITVKLLSASGTVVTSTTTDANGNYLFKDLPVGNYSVQVVAPSGYYVTRQNQGGNDAIDSDIDASGKTASTNLTAGENDLSWDAGLYRKACIGDKVWVDSNCNGIQDNGESAVKNVKVMLEDSCGRVIATTTTDANGNYNFSNLDPGSYRIAFDKSCGINVANGASVRYWDWTRADAGSDDSRDSDAYSSGWWSNVARTAYTTLESGECDNTWDAGVTPIVLDLDGNGIQTVSLLNSNGKFDLLGSGKGIDSGWISSGDAFLAIDIDGNGKIESLNELFGGTSKGTGFAKLASFDTNADGLLDAQDAAFAELRVWTDINGNHQTDDGELKTLAEAGVASLKTSFVELPAIDAEGNLHLERSSATLDDGSLIDMTDVYFNVSVSDAAEAGVTLPSLASLLGDDQSLDILLGSNGAAVPDVTAVDGAFLATNLNQLVSIYDQQYELQAA